MIGVLWLSWEKSNRFVCCICSLKHFDGLTVHAVLTEQYSGIGRQYGQLGLLPLNEYQISD